MKFEANGITYVVRDELIPQLLKKLMYHPRRNADESVTEAALNSYHHSVAGQLSDSVFRQDTQTFLKFRAERKEVAQEKLHLALKFIGDFT